MDREYNKYGNLTVPQLKTILRKRGGALKGKKKDLIERLIFYDRNNNFVIKPLLSVDEFHPLLNTLITPDIHKYKDLNTNCSLPPLTTSNILSYLEIFDISLEKGRKMYENQFLLNVRVAMDGDSYFFKGRCKASMKKAISYIIDVQVCLNGTVEACQCDCGVGEQPTAHCKHVVAVLIAIEEMKWKKKIILNVTCTQELQSFHKPNQQYFGTPLKTSNLPAGKQKLSESVNFQPINPITLKPEKYRERVRNQCIGFVANSGSTMPYKHTIMPANLYAVVTDHDYAIDLREEVLKSLKVCNLIEKDIQEIEISTREQADSLQWHDLRRHHITASNFYNCCKAVSTAAKLNLVERIINPTHFKSKQTQHGKDCESKAIKTYELWSGIKVKKCGLFLMKNNQCLAATPDGLIGDETVLEVKCPWNQRNALVNEETIPFLTIENGVLTLDPSHAYYFQIQGQLMVTGRKFANLLVYTYKDWKVVYISRDYEFIAELEAELMFFYEEYFKPALLEKYLYKNYAKCFSKIVNQV